MNPFSLRRLFLIVAAVLIFLLMIRGMLWLQSAAFQTRQAAPVMVLAEPAAVPLQNHQPETSPTALGENEVLNKAGAVTVSAPPPVPDILSDDEKKELRNEIPVAKPLIKKAAKKIRIPHEPPIIYPYEARRAGEQGRVLLDLTLSASGKVKAARIVRSSGYPLLDKAAQSGVMLWTMDPPDKDGEHLFLPVTFRLNSPQAVS